MKKTRKKSVFSRKWLRTHWQLSLVVGVVVLFGLLRLGSSMLGKGVSLQVLGLGNNGNLQLGGQNKDRSAATPEPLQLEKDMSSRDFVSAKAGHYHTLLLTKDGEVYAFGSNALLAVSPNPTQLMGKPIRVTFPGLAANEKITQIDTSRDHNIALTSMGQQLHCAAGRWHQHRSR